MNNHIDITFDLETCATTANAAVMQIAAVVWNRSAKENPFEIAVKGEKSDFIEESFDACVDLRTCVVDNFDFDQDTIRWWSEQNENAKSAVTEPEAVSIRAAFYNFIEWMKDVINGTEAKSVCLWCQGMDFDCAILKNVCNKYGLELPLNCRMFRDSRTIILEAALLHIQSAEYMYDSPKDNIVTVNDILQNPSKAYQVIEKMPEEYGNKSSVHDAMYDCIRTSWNVWKALQLIQKQ